MGLDVSKVGITATFGEGLSDFFCSEAVQCFAIFSMMLEEWV